MTVQALRVILLGPPGAGKGTQAQKLCAEFGVPHVSTGEMFRTAVAAKTPLGLAAKRFMDRGELVPDDVTIGIVEERLALADAAVGFVMDGYPRTAQQATAFDALLAGMGKRLNAAIEIAVPRDVLIKRLGARLMCSNCQATYHVVNAPPAVEGVCDRCGANIIQRNDDSDATVARRLDVYDRQTAPLLAYYAGARLLKTIDGTAAVADVYQAIVAALAPTQVRTAS